MARFRKKLNPISGTGYFSLDSRASVRENSSIAGLARVIAPGFPHHVTHRGNRRDELSILSPKCLEAIDASAEMRIVSRKETDYGLDVVWKVRFGKDFSIEGKEIEEGSIFELDATLKHTDQGWLIDNF